MVRLFADLELAGFNDFAGSIEQMIHIKTAVEIIQVNGRFLRGIGDFVHTLSEEAVYLDRHPFFVSFL